MGAYVLRRLLLMVPTLFGIMLINFIIVQLAPGGPIDQIIEQMQSGNTGIVSTRATGAASDMGASSVMVENAISAPFSVIENCPVPCSIAAYMIVSPTVLGAERRF